MISELANFRSKIEMNYHLGSSSKTNSFDVLDHEVNSFSVILLHHSFVKSLLNIVKSE